MLPHTDPARTGGRSLRVGFLVWNQFQVAHFAEIAKQFHEPDFIFTDRDARALEGFDPLWLVQYGAYCRFLTDTSLHTLDGKYDVIVTQHRPPLKTPWKKTRLVMYQYSLAKPKTAYNSRWFTADGAMVYGRFSESIVSLMCPASRVGNARFDPYFEGRLDHRILRSFRERLDSTKPTLLYLPTWGDLSTFDKFSSALRNLAKDFNVVLRPHHLTGLRDAQIRESDAEGLLDALDFPPVLDPGLYLLDLADIVVSDMSGAIFDALYGRKNVVLLGGDEQSFGKHRKADDSAIEVSRRNEIGPLANDAQGLVDAVRRVAEAPTEYSGVNEGLVEECFEQRGGCAALAAQAIHNAVEGTASKPLLQSYAAPDFASSLLSRAASAARKRKLIKPLQPEVLKSRHQLVPRLHRLSKRIGFLPTLVRWFIRSTRFVLRLTATTLNRIGRPEEAALFHMSCVREFGDRLISTVWLASHVERKGDYGLAEALYLRARTRSPTARSQYLRLLIKRRAFYEAGREIEIWPTLNQRVRARTLYQTYNATSALRFSRAAWKDGLARLFRTNFAPSTLAGTELLKRFGMMRTAEALYRSRGKEIPSDLGRLIESLGEFADVIDVAAKNEASPPQWQKCITPQGEVVQVSDVPPESVAEVYVLLSLSRQIGDDAQRAYKGSLLEFSENFVHALRTLGVNVYPRIQAGIIGATPVSRNFPAAFTWHTVNCGLTSQFHLKIGALYGFFVIDDEGYSGWGSIAEAPLSCLIEEVSANEAETNWRSLHEELVVGGKSKYAQYDAKPVDCGKYVFLPMQVLDDTVSKLADINTLELLQILSEWGASSDLKVVVKRHPMCRSPEIARTIETAQRAGSIFVSNANIHQLISNAECVITVNSGVGAEALIHLKPVVTTGGSEYAAATRRARNVSELRDILQTGSWSSASEDEIKRFLWFFTHRYMVHCGDIESISKRIRTLLARTSVRLCPEQRSSPIQAAKAAIPLVSMAAAGVSTDVETSPASIGLGEQCENLLKAFQSRGVTCWLDSGSLLGLVRNGHLNHWEKDIDLGIWVDDLEVAREVCKEITQRFGLRYREKWTRSIPYALLLNSRDVGRASMLPIAVHVFYRKGDKAWSIQPHSLVAGHSKYPKYRYRELIGNRRGKKTEKLKFVAKYPKYAIAIVIDVLNLNGRIGRRLRAIERERSVAEKLFANVFNEIFEWTIPAQYFDELAPLSEDCGHVLVPAATDEYLQARYGEWRMAVEDWFYVVDDGCIRLLHERTLDRWLDEMLAQVPSTTSEVNAN